MNRNLTKRIMSLLLVLVLLISNVPAVVFAAEETTAATGEIVVAETSAPTEAATEPAEETFSPTQPETVPEETSAPTEAEEPETEAAMAAKLELEATIEKQIRAFAKSIDKPGADDDAAREIAQHGMFGRGKKTLRREKPCADRNADEFGTGPCHGNPGLCVGHRTDAAVESV